MEAWKKENAEPLTVAAPPMKGGMGRALRLTAALDALSPPDRLLILGALDEITRPMTAREIEDALYRTGLSRGERRKLVLALKPFKILVLA